jgi:hypothetical protein
MRSLHRVAYLQSLEGRIVERVYADVLGGQRLHVGLDVGLRRIRVTMPYRVC